MGDTLVFIDSSRTIFQSGGGYEDEVVRELVVGVAEGVGPNLPIIMGAKIAVIIATTIALIAVMIAALT